MIMVVGLGNPGREYVNTRHNIGFMVVDALAQRHGAEGASERMGAWTARTTIEGRQVLLVKPQTFMNLSGEAVGKLRRWHKMDVKDIFIVADDIDLPFGKLRLRERGSAGGHNGLKSIFSHLGSQEVARLKVGVGRPAHEEARDYVLSPFDTEERAAIAALLDEADAAVALVLRQGLVNAMNVVNPPDPSRPKAPTGPGGRRGLGPRAARPSTAEATAPKRLGDADAAPGDADDDKPRRDVVQTHQEKASDA